MHNKQPSNNEGTTLTPPENHTKLFLVLATFVSLEPKDDSYISIARI